MNPRVEIANRTLLIFSAVLALAYSGIAPALPHEQLRSETVRFSDLNMSTPEGIQALYVRIHAAAWRVCSNTDGDPLYQLGAAYCAKQAEAKAIKTLNLPQLTAYYQMKTGEHATPLSASR